MPGNVLGILLKFALTSFFKRAIVKKENFSQLRDFD